VAKTFGDPCFITLKREARYCIYDLATCTVGFVYDMALLQIMFEVDNDMSNLQVLRLICYKLN